MRWHAFLVVDVDTLFVVLCTVPILLQRNTQIVHTFYFITFKTTKCKVPTLPIIRQGFIHRQKACVTRPLYFKKKLDESVVEDFAYVRLPITKNIDNFLKNLLASDFFMTSAGHL